MQKLLAKILICPYFAKGFHSREGKYGKKLSHFYCHRDNEHEHYVYTCKEHPFLFSRLEGMLNGCCCKNIIPFEMCKFCIHMRYLLNFRCYKFCVEEIPK